jgi:hypothetical protein
MVIKVIRCDMKFYRPNEDLIYSKVVLLHVSPSVRKARTQITVKQIIYGVYFCPYYSSTDHTKDRTKEKIGRGRGTNVLPQLLPPTVEQLQDQP